MRIERLKLTNFASIFAGTGKRVVDIDFTKGTNPITLIVGKNGSGKTSLLSNLHPFPYVESIDVRNSQDLILPGEQGRKEMKIVNGDHSYKIDIYYDVDKRGKRTTKCFIWKDNQALNPTGLVRSYYDVLKVEFGIEPSFLRILRLGPNVSDLVSMKASERKDYISTFLQDIDIYTKLYQTIKSESSYVKNQMKVITTNYDSIESEAELKSGEHALKLELIAVDKHLTDCLEDVTKCQYRLDNETLPDDKIQEISDRYWSAQNEVLDEYQKLELSGKWSDYGGVGKAYTQLSLEKERVQNTIDAKSAEYRLMSDQLFRVANKITDYNNQLFLIASQDSLETIDKTILEYETKMKDLVKIDKVNGSSARYSTVNMLWTEIVNTIHENMDVNVLAILKREIQYANSVDVLDYLTSVINKKLSILSEKIATAKAKDQSSIIQGKVLFVPTECKYSKNCPYFTILDKLKTKTHKQSTSYLNAEFDVYMMAKSTIEAYKHIAKTVNNINEFGVDIHIEFPGLLVAILNFDSDYIAKISETIDSLLSAAKDKELYHEYETKLEELRRQRDAILTQDSSSFIQKALDAECKELDDLENKVGEIKRVLVELKESRDGIDEKWEAVSHDYEVYTKYTHNQAYYIQLKDDYEKARHMKLIRSNMEDQIAHAKKAIDDLEQARNNLDAKLKDIYYKLKSKQDLEAQITSVQKRYEMVELVRESLSSTKGIPLIFIQLYLKNIQILANNIIHEMFGDSISLLDFTITDKEFSMPYMVNGMEIMDVSYSSQGERTTIVMALSFALLQQFMGKYNILLLDEVDSALYKDNRQKFIKILEDQMKRIGCEQAFLITHNALFENYPVNIIETSAMNGEFKNSCVIWKGEGE